MHMDYIATAIYLKWLHYTAAVTGTGCIKLAGNSVTTCCGLKFLVEVAIK